MTFATGDSFKKVQSGERLAIPAVAYNAFIDAALAARNGDEIGGGMGPFFRQSGVVKVQNKSGAARDRFEVLGIDKPIITPSENLEEFKQRIVLEGKTPAAASHQGKFVILLEPLPVDGIGWGVVSGVAPVQLKVSGSLLDFAEIADGVAGYLSNASAGTASVLWAESTASVTFTADASTDLLTATGHGLIAGTVVRLTTTGTLPAPLATGTDYYVINPLADTFQLATTEGGSAIDLTSAGTGVHSYSRVRPWAIVRLGNGSGAASSGLVDFKDSVRVATTAALAAHTRSGNVLTASSNGAFPAQDGVTLVLNERILVKNEGSGTHLENGPYSLTQVGDGSTPWKLTRTSDADSDAEVTACLLIAVSEGTVNLDSLWMLTTNDPITLNTTALTFAQRGGGGFTGTRTVVGAMTHSLTSTALRLTTTTNVFTYVDGRVTNIAADVVTNVDISLSSDSVVTVTTCTSGTLSVTNKNIQHLGTLT